MTDRETPDAAAAAAIAAAAAAPTTTAFATGPSFAAFQSLLSADQANSLLYHQAVANQQLGNIIGMVTTMNSIQDLLGNKLPPLSPWGGLAPYVMPPSTAAAGTAAMSTAAVDAAVPDANGQLAQLHRHAELQHRHQMQMIQRAGIALCVAAIAREPDKADIYTQAIEKIRKALE